mmetsp:Transcript_35521/g.80144  ORF Transcript_35521/g.80144 Transcript_35521/m.80144 type:complete len:316 (-) Transcript_35521:209-1156(-)
MRPLTPEWWPGGLTQQKTARCRPETVSSTALRAAPHARRAAANEPAPKVVSQLRSDLSLSRGSFRTCDWTLGVKATLPPLESTVPARSTTHLMYSGEWAFSRAVSGALANSLLVTKSPPAAMLSGSAARIAVTRSGASWCPGVLWCSRQSGWCSTSSRRDGSRRSSRARTRVPESPGSISEVSRASSSSDPSADPDRSAKLEKSGEPTSDASSDDPGPLAPLGRRKLPTCLPSICPATSMGSSSSWFSASGLAPRSSSWAAIPTRPSLDARCSGVSPVLGLAASTEAALAAALVRCLAACTMALAAASVPTAAAQ